MRRAVPSMLSPGVVLLLVLQPGCSAFSTNASVAATDTRHFFVQNAEPNKTPTASPAQSTFQTLATDPVTQTAFQVAAPDKPPSDMPFFSQLELDSETVKQEVLTRNPTLAKMTAAWQAASARYPQVTALDDPMFRV